MLIDPLPIKLEQELKYELAYTALSSAAATGKLPRGICQRANVGYARKCGVLVSRCLVVLVNSYLAAFRVCCM